MRANREQRVTIQDYEEFDWSVWIAETRLIASYDGSHTVWDRITGEQLYHGDDLAAAKAATGLYSLTTGATYATG